VDLGFAVRESQTVVYPFTGLVVMCGSVV